MEGLRALAALHEGKSALGSSGGGALIAARRPSTQPSRTTLRNRRAIWKRRSSAARRAVLIGRLRRHLVARLGIGRFAGDGVGATEPAREVDVRAPPRAERPGSLRCRAVADRARSRARSGRGFRHACSDRSSVRALRTGHRDDARWPGASLYRVRWGRWNPSPRVRCEQGDRATEAR
jgi:hypothetical protein